MNKWKLEWEHEKICCAVLSFHICVEGMATHSSILAWRIPVDQSLAATVHGVTESDTTEWLNVAKHVDGLNLDQEFGGMLPKKKKKMSLPIDWYQAKRHTAKPQSREGRIYYLQQVRRTLGIFPKATSPQQQNQGSFKLRAHAYSWRGLSREEFSIDVEQRLTESRLYLIEVMTVRKSQHP